MFKIQYDDQEVRQALNKLMQNTNDLTPAMRAIAGIFRDEAEQAFASETAPDGTPWQELSDNTKKARAKKGNWPGQMLQQSGSLASNINTLIGSNFAQIGTNKPYALTHQLGRDEVNIPARPFLGVSEAGKDEILTILQDHLLS